jgi:hypothetical protein
MAKKMEKLAEQIHELSDIEKLRLVDVILKDLDKPDPEIDRIWASEARKRWAAYKAVEFQWFLMSPSWRNTAAGEGALCYPPK